MLVDESPSLHHVTSWITAPLLHGQSCNHQPRSTLSLITPPPSSLPLPSPALLSSLAHCLLCSSTLFLCALFYFQQQHLIFFSAVVYLFWLICLSIIFSPVLTVSFANAGPFLYSLSFISVHCHQIHNTVSLLVCSYLWICSFWGTITQSNFTDFGNPPVDIRRLHHYTSL